MAMINYVVVYETWHEQRRIKQLSAIERTAEICNLSETDVQRIVHVISRWRARQVLRKARANNMYWRKR